MLLLCLLVMALLCCVKWFYLDPSSDREQCVGAQCDNRYSDLSLGCVYLPYRIGV